MISIDGQVVQGLRAAGTSTLSAQIRHFEQVIPGFKGCHPATINLRLNRALRIDNPDHQTQFDWGCGPPGEVFGFLKVELEFPVGSRSWQAWIYIPHGSPHFNDRFQVEIISQKIDGLGYSSPCRINLPRGNVEGDSVVV